MDEETRRMYDLVHYSGITMDPDLFTTITSLLKVRSVIIELTLDWICKGRRAS